MHYTYTQCIPINIKTRSYNPENIYHIKMEFDDTAKSSIQPF